MNIEKFVTSKELSKELAALGIKHESIFYWAKPNGEYNIFSFDSVLSWGMEIDFETYYSEQKNNEGAGIFPAFTSGELGEILVKYTWDAIVPITKRFPLYDVAKKIWYLNHREGFMNIAKDFQNEAEARGYLLKYLIENKIIEVSK